MHISQKQLEANRKNAQKSSGPKTLKGKKTVSKNAVKHGLYSQDIIIKSKTFTENAEEYQLLLDSLYDSLKPRDKLQEHLVTKIGNCIWRSQRVVRAETALLNARMDEIDDDINTATRLKRYNTRHDDEADSQLTEDELERTIENGIGKRSIITDETGAYIHRMEMRLDRQMARAYQMLRQLQATPKQKLTKTDRVGPNPCGSDKKESRDHRQPGVGKTDLLKNEETNPFRKMRLIISKLKCTCNPFVRRSKRWLCHKMREQSHFRSNLLGSIRMMSIELEPISLI